jgi:biopolymer transport protein ExbD
MSASKLASRSRRNHARYRGRNDLNIVPMIDMMVILVFFLLFTAVFSNTNILELKLPAPNSSMPELPKGLELEVVVRKDRLDIQDRTTGILRSLPVTPAGLDFKGLNEFLQFVKSKYPDKTNATVLAETDTPYETLVATMDAVRVWTVDDGKFTRAELFPDISVGDAPIIGEAAATATGSAPR